MIYSLRLVDPDNYQENHYDPWGQNLVGIETQAVDRSERKQYNGKEKTEEFGLFWNFHDARTYDLQIPRWHQIDSLADVEGQESFLSYHFSYDNPVRFSDPDGRSPLIAVGALAGFAWGAWKYGFSNGGWKKTLAATAAGAIMGATAGLGAGALTALGGVEAIGATNAAYIRLGASIGGTVASNLAEQGINNMLGSQSGFNKDDFMVSLVLSIPGGLTGISGTKYDGIKEGLGQSLQSAVSQSIERPMHTHAMRAFVKQEAAHIKKIFAANGRNISSKQAKELAQRIVQQAHQTNVTATIIAVDGGYKLGVTTIENVTQDIVKDKVATP